jgi:hypothetical protein
MNTEHQQSEGSASQKSPSFLRRFGTGVANFLIIIVVGYLGLVLIFGSLSLTMPPLSEMNPEARELIDTFYGGYITVIVLAAILSFFIAFSGFSIVGKMRNWRQARR